MRWVICKVINEERDKVEVDDEELTFFTTTWNEISTTQPPTTNITRTTSKRWIRFDFKEIRSQVEVNQVRKWILLPRKMLLNRWNLLLLFPELRMNFSNISSSIFQILWSIFEWYIVRFWDRPNVANQPSGTICCMLNVHFDSFDGQSTLCNCNFVENSLRFLCSTQEWSRFFMFENYTDSDPFFFMGKCSQITAGNVALCIENRNYSEQKKLQFFVFFYCNTTVTISIIKTYIPKIDIKHKITFSTCSSETLSCRIRWWYWMNISF